METKRQKVIVHSATDGDRNGPACFPLSSSGVGSSEHPVSKPEKTRNEKSVATNVVTNEVESEDEDDQGAVGTYNVGTKGGKISNVLLSTVVLVIRDQHGGKQMARALLDNDNIKIKIPLNFISGKSRIETILLQNVEKKMLMTLKSTTEQFQQSHAAFNEKQNSVEQNSNLFFENISSHSQVPGCNAVETFDNFLNINVSTSSSILHFDEAGNLDEYFELPAAGLNINQKHLMLIEAGNTKMIKNREQEVSKIVNSIDDLNVVFKDMSQIVQEQGTILDRIDYNIESTQTKIFEGYKQLQKADKYQRKNKRIYCILILASLIIFIIFLTISTKL
nr:syntaxin-16-like [Aedes albopictus]